MRKYCIAALSLGAILLGTGCEQANISSNQPAVNAIEVIGQGIKRPVKEVKSLEANGSLKYLGITYKTEDEGIKDIRELINSSDLEEEWIFLPKDNLWIESGRGENTDFSGYIPQGSLTTDFSGAEHLLLGHDSLVTYHFHPLWLDWKVRKAEVESQGLVEKGYPKDIAKGLMIAAALAVEGMPSDGDIAKLIRHREANEENGYDPRKFRICSYIGIIEYDTTQEARLKFNGREDPLIDEYSKKFFDRNGSILAGAITRNLNEGLIQFDPRPYAAELAANLSDNYVKLTYTPFKDIKDPLK